MATKYINLGNLQKALAEVKSRVVLKEAGKGLSTNDFTNELKTAYDQAVQKVANLEATGGQANVIEKIKVNGVEQSVGSEKDVNITVPTGTLASKNQVAEGDLESTLAQKINSKADSSALSTTDGKVTTLIGNDTGKSVRTIANEELATQLIPDGAKESLDTLQEIAQWIQEHPDDASAMNAAITSLENLVGTIPEDATADNIVAYIQEYVTGALDPYLKTADLVPATDEEIEAMFASWTA